MFSTVSSGYFSATSNYYVLFFYSCSNLDLYCIFVHTMHPAVKFNDVKDITSLLRTYLSPLETPKPDRLMNQVIWRNDKSMDYR